MIDQQFLDRYQRDLTLKGYSKRTQKTYYRSLIHFFQYCEEPLESITKEHIKDYLFYLIKDRKLSQSTLKQARNSIRYFFSQTMSRPIEVENIPCPKKTKRLPNFFTADEVFRIINSSDNLKHRTMLILAYSSGLRVSELVNLKISDICRRSMRLKIRQGKGWKDRYAILSSVCLKYLEIYWKSYHPDLWLFPGRKQETPLSTRAAQHAYHKAKKKSGVKKPGGIHTLRHSFATHMLETGSGIFQLQKFLGHKHLQTTMIYLHITEEKIIARSPLDVFAERSNNELFSNC